MVSLKTKCTPVMTIPISWNQITNLDRMRIKRFILFVAWDYFGDDLNQIIWLNCFLENKFNHIRLYDIDQLMRFEIWYECIVLFILFNEEPSLSLFKKIQCLRISKLEINNKKRGRVMLLSGHLSRDAWYKILKSGYLIIDLFKVSLITPLVINQSY